MTFKWKLLSGTFGWYCMLCSDGYIVLFVWPFHWGMFSGTFMHAVLFISWYKVIQTFLSLSMYKRWGNSKETLAIKNFNVVTSVHVLNSLMPVTCAFVDWGQARGQLKAIEQHFHKLLFFILFDVCSLFNSVQKLKQFAFMKYCPIMLHKVVLIFFPDFFLVSDHLTERIWADFY